MSSVFHAVSDPSRRSILERLRVSGALSLTAIAEPMPMSRQAVTKHLEILRAAGLIRVRREGRERMHELVAEPLREVEDWLAPYAAEWDARLDRLKQHLEEEDS